MVTHFVGWAPLVVMAVMRLSSSSLFSFSFFTRLSMARFENDSDSPPCTEPCIQCQVERFQRRDINFIFYENSFSGRLG